MQLIMIVDGKPVDSVPLSNNELQSPGWMDQMKATLEEKNEDIIDLSRQEPQFFIDALPSRMNDFDSRMNDFEKKITKH
jgi:vacuolar-type H+-ATPase subunit D/Vma8